MFKFIEKKLNNNELNREHVLVGEISMEQTSSRTVMMLIKSLLIFIISVCTVFGLFDAFNIPCSKPVIFVAFAIFSVLVSFLYVNKFVFYGGYIVIFFGILFEIIKYYSYANSGFQAIINIIYEEYSDFYALPSVRQAQELIDNRTVSVTVATLFAGFFLIILLNISVAGYMNLFDTMILTFPFLEIAFYINKNIKYPYILGILFVYIAILILNLTKHAKMKVKSKNMHEFNRLKWKNLRFYSYQGDTKVFLNSMLISLVISAIVAAMYLPFGISVPETVPKGKIRKQTDAYVKIFIQSGISGFLNGYDATGGLSSGRLGGISQIRHDFQPDLNVTFPLTSTETLYLKSFTGSSYQNNQWFVTDKQYIRNYESIRIPPESSTAKATVTNLDGQLKNSYRTYFSDSLELYFTDSQGRVIVENPNIEDHDYTFIYENDTSDNRYLRYVPENSTETITYHPYSALALDLTVATNDEFLEYNTDYGAYIYDRCIEVPEEIKPTLDKVLSEIDFTHENLNTNQYRMAVANDIYKYFVANYEYTMSPGNTPTNKDFVEYFLEKQHRGYCAHFASSETLLLREMGIPARYCEGYVIPMSLVSESAIATGDNLAEWYTGPQYISDASVINVDVNDSYAHAWVEIYLDGIGFVPFEATIPSFDEEETTNFDLSFLNNFLRNSQTGIGFETTDTENDNARSDSSFLSSLRIDTKSVSGLMIIIVVSALTLFILLFLIKWITMKIKVLKYKKSGDEYHLLKIKYDKLCRLLRRKGYLRKENPLPKDVKEAYDSYIKDYNSQHKKEINTDTDELLKHYEKVMYNR